MKEIKLSVIDYGMANLQSVKNAFNFLGYNVEITSNKDSILKSDAIVLPGVGAFGEAMRNLDKLGLVKVLRTAVTENGKPILGICLGMQLLADASEEHGCHDGLALISGTVKKIKEDGSMKLPHTGWNDVKIVRENPLFKNISDESSFYFVHSYHFSCESKFEIGNTVYTQKFSSAVQSNHIFGTQFHPERSQAKGLRLLSNFVNYVENSSQRTTDA